MVEILTINGKPDTESIAHFIVIKVLNESIVKYHGTRLGNDEVKDLTKYVKEQLDAIVETVSKN